MLVWLIINCPHLGLFFLVVASLTMLGSQFILVLQGTQCAGGPGLPLLGKTGPKIANGRYAMEEIFQPF